MKQKILYLTLFPHIGGGETSLLYLLEALDKNRYYPSVLVTKKGQVSNRLENMRIKTYIYNIKGFFIRSLFIPGISPVGILRLYHLARNIRPNIIHLNHPFLAVYGGIVGKLLHIPVVATSHGIWDCVYFYQDIINALCVDRLLPITPEVLHALTRRGIVPKSKTRVVYLGIDTNKFKPAKNKSQAKKRWGIKETDLVVTMVCRFDFTKNHITFLETALKIMEKYKNVKFLIVGDINTNLEDGTEMAIKVKSQLDEYLLQHPKLLKHVVFTDFKEDMVPIYHATDILFSSSLSETLPMSFLEGASCGLPIIAFENVSTKRIVIHNKNGFLVSSNRQDVLHLSLLKLLKSEKLREQFGKYSRDLVLKNFTIERYVREIEQVYEKLL